MNGAARKWAEATGWKRVRQGREVDEATRREALSRRNEVANRLIGYRRVLREKIEERRPVVAKFIGATENALRLSEERTKNAIIREGIMDHGKVGRSIAFAEFERSITAAKDAKSPVDAEMERLVGK